MPCAQMAQSIGPFTMDRMPCIFDVDRLASTTRSFELAKASLSTSSIQNLAAMHYRRVCIESFGYTLPDEVVSTADLERRLGPLYERLRLPEGRLELMTGIRERGFFKRVLL
jgi:hypothetical protein